MLKDNVFRRQLVEYFKKQINPPTLLLKHCIILIAIKYDSVYKVQFWLKPINLEMIEF